MIVALPASLYSLERRRAGLRIVAALGAASLPAAAFATSADDAADAAARPRGVEAERAHARAWQAYRLEAARRVVAANPELTFTSQAPTDLLAVHALASSSTPTAACVDSRSCGARATAAARSRSRSTRSAAPRPSATRVRCRAPGPSPRRCCSRRIAASSRSRCSSEAAAEQRSAVAASFSTAPGRAPASTGRMAGCSSPSPRCSPGRASSRSR